jgi:hypothetical protein
MMKSFRSTQASLSFFKSAVQRSSQPSPLDDSHQHHNDSDYQKNVNEAAQGVGSDQPEKPQYQQNRCNSEKHY